MTKQGGDPIVALDTMVMVYALRSPQKGTAEQRDLSRRARILLDQLSEEKARILIPTVSVAELLVGIQLETRGEFVVQLRQRFHCPSFDLQAAAIAADLWTHHRSLPTPDQIGRRTLKADVMIIATASSAGARRFYSHDSRCRKLAQHAKLDALDLPQSHPNLFVDHELRQKGAPAAGE